MAKTQIFSFIHVYSANMTFHFIELKMDREVMEVIYERCDSV